ncbi:hypothetical protein SAY87_002011 [Trapa incisa]|uniref:SCP domain-containing protein n=1 Tax=Trapa incisa TaxID=236973 RepID=A0AAN7JV45_9MYRT|nr:hypothetical protein SAY87_002011 [Trapa incisa]
MIRRYSENGQTLSPAGDKSSITSSTIGHKSTMEEKPFSLMHLSVFLLVSIVLLPRVPSQSYPEAPEPPSELSVLKDTHDNETIYRISKQLCWNCLGESVQFLFYHNLVRASKFELPLVWDSNLERYARWWAGQRRSDCRPEHSFPENGFKLGENIYWGSGSSWGPRDAVAAWTDEQRYYTYQTNSCEPERICGHYTQIVWRTTRRIGCARVVCDDGDVFMTCNYDPVGNYVGERPY